MQPTPTLLLGAMDRYRGALLALLMLPAAALLGCNEAGGVRDEMPPEIRSLRVVSYNVRLIGPHRTPSSLAGVEQVLEELRPDLAALQEVRLADLPRLARAARLPYHGGVPVYMDRSGGVGVLSRWPIDVRPLPLAGDPRRESLAHAVVDAGGISLSFYSVHLSHTGLGLTPGLETVATELGTNTIRAHQSRQLLELLEQDPHRLQVVAGDLNSFPGAGAYRLLVQRLRDAFPLDGSLEGTYRMPELPNPKIDHILHSKALTAQSARVVDAGPSDHLPVVAVLQIPPEAEVNGARVAELQQALAERGYDPGPIDGLLGPRTRGAIRRWQRFQQEPIDGLMTPQLLEAVLIEE